MHLTELAKRVFKGISQVEYYVASNYKPHTTISKYSIYMSICSHEDDPNIYDERPCIVLRTKGSDLHKNEVEVCRITSKVSNKKNSLVLRDFKNAGLEKLSEIRLDNKFKIQRNWLGPKLGDLSERDFENLIWKLI